MAQVLLVNQVFLLAAENTGGSTLLLIASINFLNIQVMRSYTSISDR
ncbi:MAG: hypothetical protein AB4080_22325 [Trichodesmium sp.]